MPDHPTAPPAGARSLASDVADLCAALDGERSDCPACGGSRQLEHVAGDLHYCHACFTGVEAGEDVLLDRPYALLTLAVADRLNDRRSAER